MTYLERAATIFEKLITALNLNFQNIDQFHLFQSIVSVELCNFTLLFLTFSIF